jgi:hypothetical protein
MNALENMREDDREKAKSKPLDESPLAIGDDQEEEQGREHEDREDGEAAAIADTPHLTGDPEWDAVELAETDPTREPLPESWRRPRS